MKTLNISDTLWVQARKNSIKLGQLPNSFTNGEGNLAGMIGELTVAKYLNVKLDNTYDYDMIYKDIKIDVKTKRTSVEPKDYYLCTVPAKRLQACDVYYFTRVLSNYSQVYLLGWIKASDFIDDSKLFLKGEQEPDTDFVFKQDCYAIPIRLLNKGKPKL